MTVHDRTRLIGRLRPFPRIAPISRRFACSSQAGWDAGLRTDVAACRPGIAFRSSGHPQADVRPGAWRRAFARTRGSAAQAVRAHPSLNRGAGTSLRDSPGPVRCTGRSRRRAAKPRKRQALTHGQLDAIPDRQPAARGRRPSRRFALQSEEPNVTSGAASDGQGIAEQQTRMSAPRLTPWMA
jgi:hypothetical protein